jgi:hypothetical protein
MKEWYLIEKKIDSKAGLVAQVVPLFTTTDADERFRAASGRDTIMFVILFWLARTFLPGAATLAVEVEIQAAILAFGVFALILYRLGLEFSSASSASSHLQSPGRTEHG